MPYQREIIADLFKKGVREIEIEYSGENDSGAIGDIRISETEKLKKFTVTQKTFLEDIGDEILEKECGGWEIDGGSTGVITLTIDIKGAIEYEVDHTSKFVDYNEETFEGSL